DDQLGDASRDAVIDEIAADRAHLSAIEGLDPAALSPEVRFDSDLGLHHLRLSIFSADVIRTWERRSSGASSVGDALFPIFARDYAPLPERLEAISARLEAVPEYLLAHR